MTTDAPQTSFFPGGGEMGRLMREKDWTQTPLGAPETWPQSLVIAINILLGSRYPMEIWWGPDYLRFYNDAYRPLLGPHRHPQYLGRPGVECWGELWDEIGPMLDGVMETGESTYSDDSLLLMTRKGFTEETYVSWSYGPIRNMDGQIGGVFCACDETTRKVLSRRRLACLADLARSGQGSEPQSGIIATLKDYDADIPFSAIYAVDPAVPGRLTLLAQVGMDTSLAPQQCCMDSNDLWPFGQAASEGTHIIVSVLATRLPHVPAGPWPEPPTQAVLFPLIKDGTLGGILLFGISSRLELDSAYLEFLTLVTGHIGSLLESEQARLAVEQDRLRLRSAFMQSPAFMCILHGDKHVFQFLNQQYSRLIGHRDVAGKSMAEALPEIVEQGFVNILDTVYRTGQPYVGRENQIFLQRTPGAPMDEVIVNFVYQPIQEADGTITGIFVHGTDITEEKGILREREELLTSERAARTEAERASRMKDEFLATLSHELRTPLNAVLGWSNVLRSGKADREEMLAGLATIERNARAQAQIIEDLLDMSRIISGKVRLEVQRIDLAAVLRESLQAVEAAAAAKHIRLQTTLDPEAGPVTGDPNRLQQIFWNLLNNAIKFTGKGGRVQVILQRVNSHIEVSIADTGQGIKPEFLPHIFDRFQQADSSTTRKFGGLGLGLSIVKQLVELHGGSVRARSAGDEQGATFTVHLPLTILHSEEETQPERRHPTRGGTGHSLPDLTLDGTRVLVVDDEPDARALVKRLLEDSKAHVHVAASAQGALALANREQFDVIVSDIGMPDINGYTLMERIREGGAINATTPAVALTAYARLEDRTKALRSGFQIHISKPVEPTELVTVIASLAAGPRRL